MKAWASGSARSRSATIEVVRAESGAAVGARCTAAPRSLADERGVDRWRLSLTHTDRVAEAIAVAL